VAACYATSDSTQWHSKPKYLGGWKMFDFRRITLFCLEKCLSKHKMTLFQIFLWGMAPLARPWLRLWFHLPSLNKNGVACSKQRTFDKKSRNSKSSCSIRLKFLGLVPVAIENIRENFRCKRPSAYKVIVWYATAVASSYFVKKWCCLRLAEDI